MDGEIVKDADLEAGYVHKGLEKKFQWDYNKGAYLSERVCAICTQHHSTCYCLAVEGTMNLEVPRRAQIIRTIMLELERLHSHLLAIGLTLRVHRLRELIHAVLQGPRDRARRIREDHR